MKVDRLMDAIEEIDDRYIEESAYGVRRKSRIPWGMIITAACFCMVIGATMFMQSLGILPHLNGTTATTSQSTTSPTTDSSEPTVPQPTVVLPSPERFFSEKGSLHNEALGWPFGGEGAVQYFYLLGNGDLGKSTELTEQEKTLLDSKLHFGLDYAEVWRLTPQQIEDAFWSVYGLTWEQVMANFHPGSYSTLTWTINAPVYLEETGYYYGYHHDTEDEGIEIADIETEYFDDGTIYMFYTAVSQNERRVAKLRPYDTGYHILSNTLVERFEEPIDPATIEEIKALFADKNSWYYRALENDFLSPAHLSLRYYFYNSTEFGEGLQITKEEIEELMELMPDGGTPTLVILPVSKMDAVLTEVFDITVAEMESAAFAGMKYVESIDSWCFWGGGALNTPQITIRDVVKLVGDGFAVLYNYGQRKCQINLQPHGDGYRIRAVIFGDYVPRPSVEDLFCDRGSWYNLALASFSETPQQIRLSNMFDRTYSGEPVVLTDYEKSALKELLASAGAGQITRYTAEQIDEVLLLCFNKTAEELGVDLESHFTYLEKTDCYYSLYWGTPGVSIENVRTEECEDGTVSLYYTYGRNERLVKLQPHDTGYYILSNEPYVDNTGKSEDQIAMEELFKGSSWYNRALACEYNSPKEMNLRKFFYGGFKGEPQDPTDQEREQLENLGINLNYDLMRLPVDKMNEVLTEYFGITLADMEPEAFSGLVYLESTNCYYHSTSGWLGVENFEALSVERMDDGRILVRYPYMKYEYVVTLKPHGDSYQVLSNVLAEPFRPYGVDAAELNALLQEVANGNLTEDRRNEIRLPLLGTFLEDPDLFVSSLVEQQKSQAGVLGIFAPTVNYLHPSYAAYNQTIREMLPKVQSEEEKRVIYWMAFYSGLGNFLPQTPGAQDYALLFDMMLYSDGAFAEGCAYRMEQYCKGDPTAYAAAMGLTKEEHWDLYAFQTVAFMKQEDRALVKQSMTEVIEDIKHLEGYDIKAVTACAELIIKYCDNPIK